MHCCILLCYSFNSPVTWSIIIKAIFLKTGLIDTQREAECLHKASAGSGTSKPQSPRSWPQLPQCAHSMQFKGKNEVECSEIGKILCGCLLKGNTTSSLSFLQCSSYFLIQCTSRKIKESCYITEAPSIHSVTNRKIWFFSNEKTLLLKL